MLPSPVVRTLTSFIIRTARIDYAAACAITKDESLADLPPGLSSAYPRLRHLTIDTSYLIENKNIKIPTPDPTAHLETLTLVYNDQTIPTGAFLHNRMLLALAAIEPQQVVVESHKFQYMKGQHLRLILLPFSRRKTPIQLLALRRLGLQQDPKEAAESSEPFFD
jgi:hypothetical protein